MSPVRPYCLETFLLYSYCLATSFAIIAFTSSTPQVIMEALLLAQDEESAESKGEIEVGDMISVTTVMDLTMSFIRYWKGYAPPSEC